MKKKGIIICSILGVVLLVVGILLLVMIPKKSNKELFTEAIGKSLGLVGDSEKLSNAAESTVKEVQKKISGNTYKLTLKGSVQEGEAGFTNYDGIMYFGDNQFYVKSSMNSNDKLYDMEALLKDDKYYFYVKDVLSKYYYIENISDMLSGDEVNTELLEKVVDYLADSFIEAIEEEDVKVEDAELSINGKTYKTDKYGYTFSGNTLYEVVTKFANKVKSDKDFLKEINKLIKESGVTSEYGDIELNEQDFATAIDQLIEAAKELKGLGNLVTYNVYLDGDDVISRQLTVNIPAEQMTVPVTIADYRVVESGKSYYKIAVSTMGMEAYKVEVKQVSDKESTISISMMGEEFIKGKYVEDSNGIKVTLNSTDESNDATVEIKINNDGTGSLIANSSDIRAKLEYKIEEVDSIPKVDLSNSAPYSEMPEEEREALEEFVNQFNMINNKAYLEDSNNTLCYTDSTGRVVCE